jgi:hypothetical protein
VRNRSSTPYGDRLVLGRGPLTPATQVRILLPVPVLVDWSVREREYPPAWLPGSVRFGEKGVWLLAV